MADASGKADVSTPTIQYQTLLNRVRLGRLLIGGTPAMKAAGKEFLPQEPLEAEQEYRNRLARSNLFPAYKATCQALSTKPFTKPVVLDEKAPDELAEMVKDVDRAGRDLTTFCTTVFFDSIADGISYIFVDYPTVPTTLTLADERNQKLGPYFVSLKQSDVIEIQWERRAGAAFLTRVRIAEKPILPDGEWGQRQANRVRVWYPDRWELFEEIKTPKGATWNLIENGTNTLGEIPLVPVYTGWDGFYNAAPPLEDLAFLNLRHWQSSSDQYNILHVARVPFLFGRCLPKGKDGQPLKVGPNSMVVSDNQYADLKFVEHTGQAITAGRNDLLDLREEMALLGMEPMISKATTGDITATGRALDAAEIGTRLQAWARGMEAATEAAFAFAAKWRKMTLAKPIDVKMNTDLGLALKDINEINAIIASRKNNDLSRESFLNEMKRRGLLADEFVVADELKRIDAERPPLALLEPPTDQGGGGQGDKAQPAKGGKVIPINPASKAAGGQ